MVDGALAAILQVRAQVGYQIVDEARSWYHPLSRDAHWATEPCDIEVPHTEASAGLKDNAYISSTESVMLVMISSAYCALPYQNQLIHLIA